MKCERIQELILTDYSDGQLSRQWEEEVHAHLKECTACHSFAQQVSGHVTGPLENMKRLVPDESVWMAIKANIQPVPVVYAEPTMRWTERVGQFVFSFRPALITACLFLIIGAVVLNNRFGVKHQPYLSALMTDESGSTGNDTVSGIEQYFL